MQQSQSRLPQDTKLCFLISAKNYFQLQNTSRSRSQRGKRWHQQFNHSMWSEYQILVSESNNLPAGMDSGVSNYLKSGQRRHPAKRIIVLRQTICTDQFGMCPNAGIFTQKHFQTWQKEEQPINHSNQAQRPNSEYRIPKRM